MDEAIAYYEEHGLDDAIAFYSDPDNVDGQWYTVIMDENGTIVAHFNPDLIGESLFGPIGTDAAGYEFGPVMAAADENGRWITYVFHNPATGDLGLKHGWADRHDGLLFASGWYEFASVLGVGDDTPTKDDPEGYAQRLVGEALQRLDGQGLEDTLAHYNTPESVDGPWYVFILEDRNGDLYTIANAGRPDLVGTTRVRIDANGYNYGEAFADCQRGGRRRMGELPVHAPGNARRRPETHLDRPSRRPARRRRVVRGHLTSSDASLSSPSLGEESNRGG